MQGKPRLSKIVHNIRRRIRILIIGKIQRSLDSLLIKSIRIPRDPAAKSSLRKQKLNFSIPHQYTGLIGRIIGIPFVYLRSLTLPPLTGIISQWRTSYQSVITREIVPRQSAGRRRLTVDEQPILDKYLLIYKVPTENAANPRKNLLTVIDNIFSSKWNTLFDDSVSYSCYSLAFRDRIIKGKYKVLLDALRAQLQQPTADCNETGNLSISLLNFSVPVS